MRLPTITKDNLEANVGRKTSTSEFVQREVGYYRGADVQLFPVPVVMTNRINTEAGKDWVAMELSKRVPLIIEAVHRDIANELLNGNNEHGVEGLLTAHDDDAASNVWELNGYKDDDKYKFEDSATALNFSKILMINRRMMTEDGMGSSVYLITPPGFLSFLDDKQTTSINTDPSIMLRDYSEAFSVYEHVLSHIE